MIRMLKPCLVLSLMCAAIVGSRAQSSATVFINEIHYDNTGTDTGEFIEIAGPAGTNLSGYSIVLYNGANGLSYAPPVVTLAGTIPDLQNGFGALSFAAVGLQNGSPDGIALLQGGTVVQFLSYEGIFTALNGPASGTTSVDIGVIEGGSGPIGESLQLVGTGTTYGAFTWSSSQPDTPGEVNAGQSFGGTSVGVSDVSVTEGHSGSVSASFTVTVNGPHAGVTFNIETADGTGADAATATDGDYMPRSEIAQQIPTGSTTYAFTVAINGDAAFEPDEHFIVTLSNVSGATVSGSGTGTILNDDAPPPVTSDVVISQVYGGGGNSGATFTHDFIELFNRGNSSVILSGWSVQYSSATGTGAWSVTPLSGSIAAGGYYLVQQAPGTGGTTPLPAPEATGSIAMSATGGRVALRNNTTAFEGACAAAGSAADLVGYGTSNCGEGTGSTGGTSNTLAALRKRGGCFDSNNNNTDFSTGSPNPRNSASALRSCTFATATIHDIQGDGGGTPFLGQDVETTGLVTGIKSNGFFIQTMDDEDLNPATSQGLFVFTSAAPAVAVGDSVTARGTATEFFGLTQLESSLAGDVTVGSSGHPLPAAVTLTPVILNPAGAPDQLERFEGMRMHADALVSVAPTHGFGETWTVLPGVMRPMRERGIDISLPVPPDPTSGAVDCCVPRWDQNPERIAVDSDGLGQPPVSVTSHVTLSGISGMTGPLEYSFGAYKLLPEAPVTATGNVSGAPLPVPAAGEFTVAGSNIIFFNNDDTQRRKAALAIRQVLHYPDVLGLIEILDLVSLQALADQVNADAVLAGDPDPAYEARLIEAPAGGTQNVGFLVKTSRVQIDAVTQELGDELFGTQPNPPANPIYLHDRPPLVLRATVSLPGQAPRPVIVVVNHLRSFIDVEQVSSEGARVRAKRTAQAESTAVLLQRLQTDHPATPVISIGDYNAYQFNDGFTDPVAVLRGVPTPDDQIVVDESLDLVNPDFINLTDSLPAEQRYSFIFEGTPQAIDHVLVNTVANGLVTRFAIAHTNADFPEGALFGGDASRPERYSDHDVPMAYFVFPPSADISVTATGPASPVQTGGLFNYTVTVSNDGPDDASSVTVSVPAVGGLRFSALQQPAGSSCTAPAPATSGAISCVVPSLAAGASETFVITAAVDCGIAEMTLISQAILAGSTASDPAPANNAAEVAITAANPPPAILGTIAPVVVSPLPGAPQAGAIISNAVLGSPGGVTDNCGGATLVRSGVPAGNLFPVGTTVVTWTATDAGGATTSLSASVTVLSAIESLEAIEADLVSILAASTQPALSKRVKSALADLQKAMRELDEAQRGRVTAVVFISAALRDLENIQKRGLLDAPTAQNLLQRLTGISWLLAMQRPGHAALIQLGNAAAAGGHYSAASMLYWIAINQAR